MTFEEEGPRLGFDRLLAELVDQGASIMATRSRLRELVGVNRELTSHLDLSTVLQRVVEIAAELVGAARAAIIAVSADGRHGSFTQVGMSTAQLESLPALPTTGGLLAVLLRDPETSASDPSDRGAPTMLPTGRRFLGVPILLRGELFGNLYLSESLGAGFSDDDEELALALADTAGIAIENARLFEDIRHRQRVADAVLDLSRRSLLTSDVDQVDELIDRVRQHVDADLINVSQISANGSEMVVEHAWGHGAESLKTVTFPIKDSVRESALEQETTTKVADLAEEEQGYGFEQMKDFEAVSTAPFVIGDQPGGLLSVARLRGRPAFTERDDRTLEAFAGHLTVIFERQRSRESQQRLSLLEDRERIARDLHDHVIQRLFATGMNLQVAAGQVDDDTAAAVEHQIEEIDGAIAQIRQSIFAIRASEKSSGSTLRARVLEVVERADSTRIHPTVTFLGPVDLMVDGALTDDVVAVTTEGLSNAFRHTEASAISLTIQVGNGRVQVDVIDDGAGRHDEGPRGLNTLRSRAEARDGQLTVLTEPGQGTRLTWTASTF